MSADADGLLTLHEAADRLGVHYMTVYRRVRLGVLPARRVGGTWRIDPAALDRPSAPTTTAGSRRAADWDVRLTDRLLAGDAAGAWSVVEAAMASGVEPADVYVTILAPSLAAIGDGWERGTVAIEREHVASSIAAGIIGRLGPRFRPRGRRRGSVIVAMPPGERHGLGSAMLADIVAAGGFDVFNLGPDTPPAALAAAIREHDDLRAVLISVVDHQRREAAGRLVAAAHEARPGVVVLAGGRAIPDEQTALALGADRWTNDPRLVADVIDASPVRTVGEPVRAEEGRRGQGTRR